MPANSNNHLLSISSEGARTEICIDTGQPLPTGNTAKACAKLYCADALHARLIADCLRQRLGDAIEAARRQAYEQGYRDARHRNNRLRRFGRSL